MLPGKLGKSLGRHVLIREPGHIPALGIRSHLESADGKAALGLLITASWGARAACWKRSGSCRRRQPLGRHALHLFPGLSCVASRDCLEDGLSLFLKVIDLKSSFWICFCSYTQNI